MTIAIIDDEPINRLVLKKIIAKRCQDKKIILEDGIVESTILKINALQPDIVLLDIELKNGTGFDVLKNLNYNPQIIFTTAYEKYAIQAIKAKASDYILKPIDEEELIAALISCKNKIEKLKLEAKPQPKRFFSYSTNEESKSLETDEILYFEGAGSYVYCITKNDKILISKNIGEIEKNLDSQSFVRCHQSYIVNLKHIKTFDKKRTGNLYLINGEGIPVSQRKVKLIATHLNN